MLYWKSGNDSLRTDEIVLSQFFIEEFNPSSGLAFYSSTGTICVFFKCIFIFYFCILLLLIFPLPKGQSNSRLCLRFLSGWYNRLYINFILRRHIFFFMLQTYFPTMLMVVLSWVSFWIDRRAVPARVSLGTTHMQNYGWTLTLFEPNSLSTTFTFL